MNIQSNIPDVIAKLDRLKSELGAPGAPPPPAITDALYSALNEGMGKMKFRIFNKGLDAEGKMLGNYHGPKSKLTKNKLSIISGDEFEIREKKTRKRNINRNVKSNPEIKYTEYEKYRLSRGRQIGYKDLEMDGSLRRSIEAIKTSDGKVVIAIVNEDTGKIAGYQEQQVGNIRAGQNANKGKAVSANIFELSQEEFEQVQEEGNTAIGQIIKQMFEQ